MNKTKRTIIGLYRLITISATVYVTWKIVRYWRKGIAEKAGRVIDSSVRAVVEEIGKTASTVESGAKSVMGKHLGKGLDEVLTDTKKALKKASDLVKPTVHRAK
jgi:hypothetical protein